MNLASAPIHRCHGHAGCPKELERSRWPFLDAAIDALERTIPSVQIEFDAAHKAGLAVEHGEGIHLTGMWDLIHMGCPVGPAAGELEESQAHPMANGQRGMFPKTCQALREFDHAANQGRTFKAVEVRGGGVKGRHPHIQEARFATLHPGTVVGQHTSSTNQRIKVHCGIRNPSRIAIQIANHSLVWEEGKCILIDDSYEHALSSPKEAQRRTILELKISHPDLDHAPLLDDEDGRVMITRDGTILPGAGAEHDDNGQIRDEV